MPNYRNSLHLILAMALAFGSAGAAGLAPGVGNLSDRAYAACNPQRSPAYGTWAAGGRNTGFSGAVGGVYAQIRRYDPYIYGPYLVEVTDWVMLAGSASNNWSQIGWAYSKAGTQVFVQVTDPGKPAGFETWFGPAVSNNYPTFTALYNYQPNKFSFQVDGSWWQPPGWSYGSFHPNATFVPSSVQVFGESKNYANQFPGGRDDKAGHWEAHLYYNGAWQDGWLTMYNSGGPFAVDPVSGQLGYYNGKQFYIWDTACAY